MIYIIQYISVHKMAWKYNYSKYFYRNRQFISTLSGYIGSSVLIHDIKYTSTMQFELESLYRQVIFHRNGTKGKSNMDRNTDV